MSPLCLCILLVIVPSVEVRIGTVGQPYLWNCTYQTLDLSQSSIYWQNKNDSLMLFFYKNGQEIKKDTSFLFQDRTSVFPELLASGNLSLLIDPLKVKDDGLEVKVKVTGKETIRMCEQEISVAAPYSDLRVDQSENEEAVCSAVGGYPEPSLTWTGLNETSGSTSLTALNYTLKTLHDGTYSVSSSVSVEGLISVTCHLQNLRANQSISLTKIGPEGPNRGAIIGGVVGGIILLALVAVAIYCWKPSSVI